MNEINFNPGAIPDAPDERDYSLEEVAGAVTPFDWDKGYDVEDDLRIALKDPTFHIPVKDQNGSSSCGGQAWSYYGEVLEALATGTFEERSAKFIYAQTFVQGGGSAGRTNCQLVQKQGWGKEALTPSYENGKAPSEAFITRPQDITDAARQAAKSAKALVYAAPLLDIDQMAAAIKINKGIIIGITGTNNGTWYTEFPKSPKDGDKLWRHWLYAGRAKMINGKKYIGVLNSWGKAAGKNGWQWISEDYIQHEGMIFNVWTLVYDTTLVSPVFTHHFGVNITYGQRNDEVKALQTALKFMGLYAAPITGYFGDITARALLAFQQAQNIYPTASRSCGVRSRAALNQLFDK